MTPNNPRTQNYQKNDSNGKWLKKQKRTRYGLNNAILQYISTHPKNVHKEPKICAIVSHELYTKSLFISSVVSYLYKCNAQSCNFKKMEVYETKPLNCSSDQN